MNSFVIFAFVATIAVASGATLGYGYGPGVSGIDTRYHGGGGGGGAIIGGGGIGQIISGNRAGFTSHHHQQPLAPIITKNFYIHSAPEETEQEIRQEINQQGQPRKHYNVVFIKAPKHSLRASAHSLAQQLNEERTAIYVLSKKPDVSEFQSAFHDVPHHPHKPEVFFIKYNTAEEAQHAQHQIQTQYDQLGGSSQISDEGIAPVSSVIGSLDSGIDSGASSIGQGVISSGGSGGLISSGSAEFSTRGGHGNYLPPQ